MMESVKSFSMERNPEMEEQLILTKIEKNLKKSLKFVKSMNKNKDGKIKERAELTNLIEEIGNEYQSMYDLYDSLTSDPRRLFTAENETGSSTTSSAYSSASYSDMEFLTPKEPYTPMRLDGKRLENSDSEHSTSKVKNIASMEALSSNRDEVPESGLAINDVQIHDEQLLDMRGKLMEREDELLSITKKHQAFEEEKMAEIKALKDKVTSLELELNAMSISKNAQSQEVSDIREENAGLKVQIAKLKQQFNENENQLSTVTRKLEEDKKGLQEQNNALQEELAKKAFHVEKMKDDSVKNLEEEISTLSNQKKELDNEITSAKSKADQLRGENERLYSRIFALETAMKERENESSALQEELEVQSNEMSTQIRAVTEKLQALHKEKTELELQLKEVKQHSSQNLTSIEEKNVELTNKIADQQKSLDKLTEEKKEFKNRLNEAKANYQIAEKKIEEMAEDFFKKCEDQFRILSRRIRVAEQLDVENKEWYQKTRDRYEQQNNELKERLEKNAIWMRNIKDIALTADNTLSTLDGMALKFEGCTADFHNRISKVSCELKFAKDWVTRKNKAMAHVRDDMTCLLAQLDDKEAEILLYRERVWKSEHKVRELEKEMNEKEEGMLALQEEKREAIRQLCVWIDYHRSHSDCYKKILSEMNSNANKKTR